MKYLVFAMLIVSQVLQQERYPGQGEHREPPTGWYCEHQKYDLSVPPPHDCSCERSCDQETGRIVEDKSCAVWCHADHCHCTIGNMKACHK